MSKNNLIQIGGELVNTVGDGIIADAAAVKDYNKNKTQQTINSELTASVENISRSVPSSGNVVKIESQQGNSVLVLKNEDGTEVSTIVGATDRYSGWEQGGDTRIPTIGLVKGKLSVIEAVIPSAASAQNQLADKNYVDTHSSDINVDDTLSTTSENPVQNKVVTNALNETVKNKGSESNIVVGVGNSSNIGITSSSIGMETGNSAILIGNDITLNTSGSVKYNGSRVATATDLQGKQDVIQDLSTIRSGASAGATAYQKSQAGIPKTDLASAVQTSLGKADTALQAHQDISGKADVAALAGYTPTANFATINGASITGGGDVIITAGSSSITTIDATPTSGSTNPVQSGGVYDAIEGGFYY